MIYLIAGGTHLGKTTLAQKMLETYGYPYLSIDHLKMGLIRAGHTTLTPMDSDEDLTAYLWPIVREMIKTCIENDQNLIVEGCYIPFDWAKDFEDEYAEKIHALWLIFSEDYIRAHFDDVRQWASVTENRGEDPYLSIDELFADTRRNLAGCKAHGCRYHLFDTTYDLDAAMAQLVETVE